MAQDPLCLLCVEPYFPGRLGRGGRLAGPPTGLSRPFLLPSGRRPGALARVGGKGLELVTFNVGGVAKEPAVHWSRGLERGLCYAYGAWEVYDARRPRPIDVILGRSAGLGSNLFASVAYPGVPRVNFFDYYYLAHQNDLAGEAGPDMPVEYFHWRRAANAMDLLDLENDVGRLGADRVAAATLSARVSRRFHGPVRRRRLRGGSRRVAPSGPHARRPGRSRPGTKIVTLRVQRPRLAPRLRSLRGARQSPARSEADVICVVVGGGPVGADARRPLPRPGLRPASAWRTTRPPTRRGSGTSASCAPTRRGRAAERERPARLPEPDRTRWPDRWSRRWRPAASSWPGTPSRCASSSITSRPGCSSRRRPRRGRRRLALEALDDPAAHRPIGEAAAPEGPRAVLPGRLPAAARRRCSTVSPPSTDDRHRR